jgi:succinoglycan biosynthesis transport protein ExoP
MFRRDLILATDGRTFEPQADRRREAGSEVQRPAGREFDFERARLILRRNQWLIVACLGISVLGAIILTSIATPVYRASASVQLEQQSTRVMKGDDLQPGEANFADAERFLQTQVDVMGSRSLAIRVADRLQLFRGSEFLTAMGITFKPKGSPAEQIRKLRERTIRALQGNLQVSLPRFSRLATIWFSSPDRELAARVANAYAEALIADNLERRFKASSYARDFLEGQLEQAKNKLEASERAAILYAGNAGLIDTGPAAGAPGERARSLVTSSLVTMNDTLTGLTAERLRAQQRWEQARQAPVMSLPEVLGNPAIQELTRNRAELSSDYQKELETRLGDHPSVRQAKAQLDETNAQIAQLAGSIRNGIRESYEVALKQEGAVEQDLQKLRANTLTEQGRGIRYGILRREVDTNRQMYDGLLQRYKEVAAAAGVTANNISIVDTAEPAPQPSWPKPMLNVAISLFLGMIAAAGLIFLREVLDDAVRTPDDVEGKLGLTLLGTVPRIGAGLAPIEALDAPRSALSESYSSLRTALEFAGEGGVPRRLLVTSSQASEGKSMTSYALARGLASIGKRVLLVDGDLRKPSLAKLLGIQHATGFSNVLNGTAKAADQAIQLPTPNLSFMPSGPQPPNPADLFGRAQARAMIEHLSDSFDVVVIDGPPVLGLADAPLLAGAVEGVIFLIDTSQSHRGRVRTAVRRLQRAHGHLLGVVLTMFDPKTAGYGGYGYSYDYGGRPRSRRLLPRFVADRF